MNVKKAEPAAGSIAALVREVELHLLDSRHVQHPAADARELVAAVLEVPRSWPVLHASAPAGDELRAAVMAAAGRLAAGAPMQYAVGRAAFRNLVLDVDPRTVLRTKVESEDAVNPYTVTLVEGVYAHRDRIDELIAMVETARSVPMSRNNCMVDRGEMIAALDEMRADLPADLRRAAALLVQLEIGDTAELQRLQLDVEARMTRASRIEQPAGADRGHAARVAGARAAGAARRPGIRGAGRGGAGVDRLPRVRWPGPGARR